MESTLIPWVVGGGTILMIVLWSLISVARDAAYSKKLSAHGWTFVTDPDISIAHGLNAPPFGIGTGRRVDDQVYGTTPDGQGFQLFRYDTDGERWRRYVCFPLPHALPTAFVSRPGRERPGAVGVRQTVGDWSVVSAEPEWGREVGGALGPALDAAGVDLDVSIDGRTLVVADAPRAPEELAAYLRVAAPVAAAARSLRSTAEVTVPRELSFYGRPRWTYRPEDDSKLDAVECTRGGQDHEATDVATAAEAGLRLIGLTHHWKTRHTRRVSDGHGGTRTETYTESHEEAILEIALPFAFGDLSANWGGLGEPRRIRLESEDFNRAFTIRASDARFAYDVLHPRAMEWVTAHCPAPFRIENGRLRFLVKRNDIELFAAALDFALGFFARVPSFVWDNLGVGEPPAELAAYEA